MATAHAKNRAPSAAKRWLSCPYSAFLAPMYPNEATEASLKGDYWHELMECKILFGVVPDGTDPDAAEAMDVLAEYVWRRYEEMGGAGKVRVFVEQQLDIPETGEFGTGDIILVSDREIEVIDEKSGYVPVNVKMNAQLMLYLLGTIAIHGERKKYRLTIHQPNYDHIDGTIRSYDVSEDDIEWIRKEIKYSIDNEDTCAAGKHCKETYCPHRGACAPFAAYVGRDLSIGWYSSEVKTMPDNDLALALDAADELAGYRKELGAEAMRRIINMDRHIDGYKVCKGRKSRAVLKPAELVQSVHDQMGDDWAIKLFPDLAPYISALSFPMDPEDAALKFLGTPKHIENIIRLYATEHKLPRGKWKDVYDNVVGKYIRETASGLSLEKAIYGRPAHKRGSEFSAIPASPASVSII